MTEKSLRTRIQNKHDTEANWNKATSFIPKAGELIIYDQDENFNYVRLKIGNGEKTVIELPFYEKNIEEKINNKQDSISGTEGQFVVIDSNGKPTAKTILIAEEMSF